MFYFQLLRKTHTLITLSRLESLQFNALERILGLDRLN